MIALLGLGVLTLLLVFGLTAFIGAPYVPSRAVDVQRLFQRDVPLKKDDVVLDIGSGDGAVLAAAAEAGAWVIGYEINPLLVLVSRWRLRRFGKKARVKLINAWTASPLEYVSVVYAFGAGLHLEKIYRLSVRQATAQGAPLRLVSYGYQLTLRKKDRLLRQAGPYFIYDVYPGFTDGEA